jgi:putative spermidine/putrescine transport system ATP-binding protein
MCADQMRGAELEIDRVEVAYGVTKVLKGVSLGVRGGEFVALLGSSGCGKTTLLRAISGLVPVSAGSILMDRRDITVLAPDKREMAMVFQSYALWPHMTVAQNMGYGLKLRGLARQAIARRVEELLTMLKLDGLGQRMVTQLSGGQRQRVALGRALAISPKVLLLDEPLSNLDARIREDVRHEIRSLQKSLGITAIHVTHDREEAMIMADRIVILDKGEIAQTGTPEEIYNRPASPFVATFLGAGNMVRLHARTTREAIEIEAGALNGPARLPPSRPIRPGPIYGYFRSEAAKIVVASDPVMAGDLYLSGRIAQSTYPGGFWRYSLAVGDQHYVVDDTRRLEVGTEVRIHLPAHGLHIFQGG